MPACEANLLPITRRHYEGTLGRMVNDTTLYNELVRLSRSTRLLLDDIRERPGRYFHISVF